MVVVNPNSSEGASIQEKYGPMEYHAWDVIRYQGRDVTVLPYDQRIELLKAVFTVINKNAELARLFKYVPVIMENKQEFYNDVVAKGGEGIILKDMTAVYRLGARPTTLLKVKRFEELDAFVVGFTPGKEGKALEDLVGGLVFAVYDEETGTQNVIGNISGLPMEFRRAATIPCQPILVPSSKEFIIGATDRKGGTRTISYTINPEFLGKVATIQGQEFTPRNFRFAHCRFTTAYKSNGKFHPWREDKTRNECKEDIKKIAASAGLVEA
jgi:ATP-dependent DNA ligase